MNIDLSRVAGAGFHALKILDRARDTIMARCYAVLLVLAAPVASLKPTSRRRAINGVAAAAIGGLPIAAVAADNDRSFGAVISKELGISGEGGKIELPYMLTDKPFKNMKCTPSSWRQCPDQAAQSPARRGDAETEDQLANKFTRRRAELQIEKAGGTVDAPAATETKPAPPPPAATSKAQGLPEPWVEVTDEKTGKVYYGNTKTGKTQFERPE